METLESLVCEDALERIPAADGIRFCAQLGCEVVYFHGRSGERILESELLVAVGQKQTSLDRTLCYCFGHTALEIEEEVAETGSSTVPDQISDKCRRGLHRCEVTNPQGTCCLGNVRQVLNEARNRTGTGRPELAATGMTSCAVDSECPPHEPVPTAMAGPTRNVGMWAIGGAVVSAVLSSACCWLPLLLITLGASAAGVSGFFEAHRFSLLAATGLFLASGFYFVYFRKERCEPGEACAVPSAKLIRFNRVMLWMAAVVVLAFALFPNYVGALLGTGAEPRTNSRPAGGPAEVRTVGIHIAGMTCAGCAAGLEARLASLPGVESVSVVYEKQRAILQLSRTVRVEQVFAAVSAGGFEGTLEENRE